MLILETVTAFKDGETIVLTINNKTAYKNKSIIELDVPPIIIDGRTLVPLGFIAESFNNATVNWNGEKRTVVIVQEEAHLQNEQQQTISSVEDIVEAVTSAVVYIETSKGHGSGFIVEDNKITTAYHVIKDCSWAEATLTNGRTLNITGIAYY